MFGRQFVNFRFHFDGWSWGLHLNQAEFKIFADFSLIANRIICHLVFEKSIEMPDIVDRHCRVGPETQTY
jgi:hypothetical protein